MSTRAPRLLAISDSKAWLRSAPGHSGPEVLCDWIERLDRAGVDGAQIREKHLEDQQLFDWVRLAVTTARGRLRILVNGRPDIALAAGADGVHLPSSGLSVEACRRLLGPEPWIGCSTHHPREVAVARTHGADYVTFGPVFPTPSKAVYGPPPGLDALTLACAEGLPVLALGGVNAERLEAVATAGAHGASAIRALHDPNGLVKMARRSRVFWPSDGSRAES